MIEFFHTDIMNYIKKANVVFNDVFSDEKSYLGHGDLHRYNIMNTNDTIAAIDPIGYIVLIELDIARFIGTELTLIQIKTENNLKICLSIVFRVFHQKRKLNQYFSLILFSDSTTVFMKTIVLSLAING